MIVNFLIALIDEANSIAKQKPKDPDFLELIVYIIMVTFYDCNIFLNRIQMRLRKTKKRALEDLEVLDNQNSRRVSVMEIELLDKK